MENNNNMTDNLKGMIADIQRCSIHDGPGIRTTVFMKGCNLRCAWCHNPETVDSNSEWILNPEKCIHCGKCDEGCYSGARILCGKEYTVDEILSEILLDKPYYGKDGGLTISGGEPLMQHEFVLALLMSAKLKGVHVAIETNMSFPWDIVEPIANECDLIMADLKLWNNENHKKWTGLGNGRIRENLCRISELGTPIILRTPIIPEVNATEGEISSIAKFASGLSSLLYYEVLPYHPLGQSKNLREGGFMCQEFEIPKKELVHKLAKIAKKENISVRVAGKKYKINFMEDN